MLAELFRMDLTKIATLFMQVEFHDSVGNRRRILHGSAFDNIREMPKESI